MEVCTVDEKLESLLKQKGYFQTKDEFKRITYILEIFASLYPFENLDVLLEKENPITPSYITEKMLRRGRGGVCYELNALLYMVLKELGFNVYLASATVESPKTGWIIDRTHAINIYEKQGKMYVIDSGSGNNLSMAPLELDGPVVTSPAGKFRLRTKTTERGTIVSEKMGEKDWLLRYAFVPTPVGWEDFNRIKKMIHHHGESPFNKSLLIAQTLPDGTISVNDERLLRKWSDGTVKKVPFTSEEEKLNTIKKHFHPSVYEDAVKYVEQKKQQKPI